MFKNLRSRSKSSSKTSKPSVFRVLSTDSHAHSREHGDAEAESKMQPTACMATESADDYGKFLAKAKKDAEKAEKKRLKEVEEAERRKREVNMSPWARGF
ncbi:hypothetical protein LOCC1_G007581 [Lachnellula occidentalis]|uniref:Uncharacterized protein n=1 Tax=Lachnellula occidentalis TaxID=215460 RepID=A0A8H8UAK1_9HELO|nr:hypothetical protein LOCC1_G007581 [Lachnellula occidentalis]